MFFDTHCHLNDSRFLEDVEGYINRAKEAGVTTLLVIAWDIASSELAIKLAEEHDGVYAAVGIHPVDAVKTPVSDLEKLKPLLAHRKVIALGEIGLDYHWIKDSDERAIEHFFFIEQIKIANEYKKPVVIHMRDATEDTYKILAANVPAYSGIMHSYSSSKEMVTKFLDLGMYIGLGGPVTYTNAKEPKEVAVVVPSDKLLLETDAPYLSPHPYRGKTNESMRIPVIAETIASLRNISVAELAATTTVNARTLFKL